ncbi:hypothetical protein ACOSP7_010248 [Xanthoceras sorbifolium]
MTSMYVKKDTSWKGVFGCYGGVVWMISSYVVSEGWLAVALQILAAFVKWSHSPSGGNWVNIETWPRSNLWSSGLVAAFVQTWTVTAQLVPKSSKAASVEFKKEAEQMSTSIRCVIIEKSSVK